jgi:hypothetical protein
MPGDGITSTNPSKTSALFHRHVLGKPNLHERVLQAHHSDNQTVYTQREANDPHIETDQSVIFDQSLAYKVSAEPRR